MCKPFLISDLLKIFLETHLIKQDFNHSTLFLLDAV